MSDSRRCRKVSETFLQKPVGELHDVVNEKQMKEIADGTHSYLFNCTYERTDIPEEFLSVIRSGDVVDELTKEINEAVKTARRNGAWRDEYMRTGLYLDDAFHEGKAVGREEGREEAREEQRILLEQERKRAEEAEAKADELAQEVMELKKKLAELK